MTDKLSGKFNQSGSGASKRGPSVRVRVSIEEQAIIRDGAERAGLSVSGYIRNAVLDAPTTRAIRQPRVNRKLAAQLLGQLGIVRQAFEDAALELDITEGQKQYDATCRDFAELRTLWFEVFGREP
jgi:mobilization protein NikA